MLIGSCCMWNSHRSNGSKPIDLFILESALVNVEIESIWPPYWMPVSEKRVNSRFVWPMKFGLPASRVNLSNLQAWAADRSLWHGPPPLELCAAHQEKQPTSEQPTEGRQKSCLSHPPKERLQDSCKSFGELRVTVICEVWRTLLVPESYRTLLVVSQPLPYSTHSLNRASYVLHTLSRDQNTDLSATFGPPYTKFSTEPIFLGRTWGKARDPRVDERRVQEQPPRGVAHERKW